MQAEDIFKPFIGDDVNAVWTAFSDSYKNVYGIHPIFKHRFINEIVGFIQEVGLKDALLYARVYPSCRYKFYCMRNHCISELSRDVQPLINWIHNPEIFSKKNGEQSDVPNVFEFLDAPVKPETQEATM